MREICLVLSPGTEVTVGEKISAIVTGVCVREGHNDPKSVTYEVTWWDKNDRHVEWFQESEVHGDVSKTVSIGFRKNAQ